MAQDDARAAARAAAQRAGVDVHVLSDVSQMQEVADLFVEVWRTRRMAPPVNSDLLRALSHAGSYVAGAYLDDELVGASVGFFGVHATLHSHISGVRAGMQGRSVGLALKLHQRAWCLDRGIETVAWTFDPLVRRNAWFNFTKLGAVGVQYLVDFYGSMKDGVNAGDASDRVYVRWDLLSDRAVAAASGSPLEPQPRAHAGARLMLDDRDGRPAAVDGPPPAGEPLLVATPYDVVALRCSDPTTALAWRKAVREVVEPAVADGYVISGITRSGTYVLTRSTS